MSKDQLNQVASTSDLSINDALAAVTPPSAADPKNDSLHTKTNPEVKHPDVEQGFATSVGN
jgi:hypothetical protein